jgi:hypothetical protein
MSGTWGVFAGRWETSLDPVPRFDALQERDIPPRDASRATTAIMLRHRPNLSNGKTPEFNQKNPTDGEGVHGGDERDCHFAAHPACTCEGAYDESRKRARKAASLGRRDRRAESH